MGYLDFFKAGKKNYIKSPDKAPKGAQVHRGPKGGYYYYSTDDPKSPEYEGVEQPKGKYEPYKEESPWKKDADLDKLREGKEDSIAKHWRSEDNYQEMIKFSEMEFPENYESWEKAGEWEYLHAKLPKYITTDPEETLKLLTNDGLPVYTGKIEINNLNHQPIGLGGEEGVVRDKKQTAKWIQEHYTEEWKMGDVSIKVPLRNNYYKHNPPDDMQDQLQSCAECLSANFEDAPNVVPFISFTPKETEYLFQYTDRDGGKHSANAWGSCAPASFSGWDERSKGDLPGNFIQIYNEAGRNDKSLFHELGHGIANQMAEIDMSSKTPDLVVDGKTYSQSWNDDWAKKSEYYGNTKSVRLVNARKMRDWNAFMEKWKDKFPEFGMSRGSYGQQWNTPETAEEYAESPWYDIKLTCKTVGDIMKKTEWKEAGREHYETYSSEPHSFSGKAPALRLRVNDDHERVEDYTDPKFDWIEEMNEDLVAMFGKKSDIGREPEWGWDYEEKDGTWNTGNSWEAFTEMMHDRKGNYDKDPFYGPDNSKYNPEELLEKEWWEEYKKFNPGVDDMASTDRPKLSMGNISPDLLPTKDNPSGKLPKSDTHRSVVFDPQEIKDLNEMKKKVKLQGRYKTGFNTAWKYEQFHDIDGSQKEYANQSATESFAEFYGMTMPDMKKLKQYNDMGLKSHGKSYEVNKKAEDGVQEWLDKEEKKDRDALGDEFEYWNYTKRAEKKEEYKATFADELAEADKEDLKHLEKFRFGEHFTPGSEKDYRAAEAHEAWSSGHSFKDLNEFSKYNPLKWDWWSRNIMGKELKRYGLPKISDKSEQWMTETPAGEKAREGKERNWAIRYEKEHGELPEGWSRGGD